MTTHSAGARREFDPHGFGAALRATRQRRGWSTRELARRAGISQAYVVTLERGRTKPGGVNDRPSPTLAMVASLSQALGVDPIELVGSGLRPAGTHVLAVVGDAGADLLAAARRGAGRDLRWVWAASTRRSPAAGSAPDATIDLRRTPTERYDPAAITAALGTELRAVDREETNRHLGIVFAESSTGLTSDVSAVLDLEHGWASHVAAAAGTADLTVGCNVCAYPIEALRSLDDPGAVTLDLISSHDEVWFLHGTQRRSGVAAIRRLGTALLPPGSPRRRWAEQAELERTNAAGAA